MNFVSDRLADGRSFRILTVIHQFTRECICLEADRSMTGMKVAQALERAKQERGKLPESITVYNGSEFCSRALEVWAMGHDVRLCFIRPGHPVENGKFQRPIARRVSERGVVFVAGRSSEEVGKLPRALQSPATAQCPGRQNAWSICGLAQGTR
jgi:transposase InsO family protein